MTADSGNRKRPQPSGGGVVDASSSTINPAPALHLPINLQGFTLDANSLAQLGLMNGLIQQPVIQGLSLADAVGFNHTGLGGSSTNNHPLNFDANLSMAQYNVGGGGGINNTNLSIQNFLQQKNASASNFQIPLQAAQVKQSQAQVVPPNVLPQVTGTAGVPQHHQQLQQQHQNTLQQQHQQVSRQSTLQQQPPINFNTQDANVFHVQNNAQVQVPAVAPNTNNLQNNTFPVPTQQHNPQTVSTIPTIQQQPVGTVHTNYMLQPQNQSQTPTQAVPPAPAPPPAPQVQQLPPIHPHQMGLAGVELRPFGMTPQELLNYAVLVNILHTSMAQGNSISNFVLNRPHAVGGVQNEVAQSQTNPATSVAAASSTDQVSYEGNQTRSTLPGASAAQQRKKNTTRNEAKRPRLLGLSAATNDHVVRVQNEDPKTRCVPMWTNEDGSTLSTQQCWLRKQIEFFPACQKDIRRHTRGRNRLLEIGQLGIQCVHCKYLPQEGRGKGSSYFPSSTKSLYQAAQNILAYHFKENTCPLIPQRTLQEGRDAASSSAAANVPKSRTGGGKPFWEESALQISGILDTTVGLRYNNDASQEYTPLESVNVGFSDGVISEDVVRSYCHSDSQLCLLCDKGVVTDFVFMLMSQYIPYSDGTRKAIADDYSDLGSEDEEDEDRNSIGIACRFCQGTEDRKNEREGVFLSYKATTMMRNKNLARLHSHIQKCRHVPENLKSALVQAKTVHLPQNDQLKRGWKKDFFENVVVRLKGVLNVV